MHNTKYGLDALWRPVHLIAVDCAQMGYKKK